MHADKSVFATLVDEQGRITQARNALSAKANQRKLTENETLALLFTEATRAGAVIGAERDAVARALAAGERIGSVVAAFLDRARQRIREGVDYRQLSGAARRDAETPGAGDAGSGRGVEADANQGGLFQAPPAFGMPPTPPLLTGKVGAAADLVGRFTATWDERVSFDAGVLRLRQEILDEGLRTGMEHLTAIDASSGRLVSGMTSSSPRGVNFEAALLAALNDKAQRLLSQHNHPRSMPLTVQDLQVLGYPGAHGHNGVDYLALRGDATVADFGAIVGQKHAEGHRWAQQHLERLWAKAVAAGEANPDLASRFNRARTRRAALWFARNGLIQYAHTAPLRELDDLIPNWRAAFEQMVADRVKGAPAGSAALGNFAHGENYVDGFDRLPRSLRQQDGLAGVRGGNQDVASVGATRPGDQTRGGGDTDGTGGLLASVGRSSVDAVPTVDGPRAQLVMPGAERIGTGELLARQQAESGSAWQSMQETPSRLNEGHKLLDDGLTARGIVDEGLSLHAQVLRLS